MSKFCTKCGKPIPEGGICSCQLKAGKPASGGQQPGGVPSQNQQPGSQQYQGQQPGGGSSQGQQRGSQQYYGQQMPNGQQIPPNQQYHGQQPGNGPFQSQQPGSQQYHGQQIPPNQPYYGQQFYNQQPNGQPYKAQASAFAQNFFGKVWNLVKCPVTAGKALIMEADVKAALLLIVFQGIFSAIFAMAVAGKLSSYIKAASGIADGFSAGMGSVVAGVMAMPYFRIFVVTVLFSLGLACVLALLFLLGHMALQIPVSFQQMLSAVSIRSAVLVPAILLSILVFELFAGMGVTLFVLVNIWGFSAMLVAMSAFVEPAKMNTFVLMASIVILLFVFICAFALSRIWTLYLPDLMRTAFKSMGDLSWNDLLQEILQDIY